MASFIFFPEGFMAIFRLLQYSFPFRLLALHFRSHLLLVGVWVVLALMVTGLLGHFFGFYYLFLAPEYRGEVNFWSYFITGAAFGIFVVIWNLTCYLLSSFRFPFLATLKAPFTKFSLNNAIIPFLFLSVYIGAIVSYLRYNELTSVAEILINVGAFGLGTVLITSILALYLTFTNKDIVSFFGAGKLVPMPGARLFVPGRHAPTLTEIRAGIGAWRVDTYFTELFRLRLVRSVLHYHPEMLGRVFKQNHSNAVFVQFVVLVLLMILGLFMDKEWARLPTGATLFLLASIFVALYGSITFWFRQWGTLVFISLLLAVNYITGMGFFNYRNRAYGLNYDRELRVPYTYTALTTLCTPEKIERDKAETLKILNNWLKRNREAGIVRPKIIFVGVSGGGLRSALWTMQALQKADQATDGRLMRQCLMITGASGGMFGAAYLREAYLREQQGSGGSIYDSSLFEDAGRDLLNSVSFSIVSNDLFFPLSTFKFAGQIYRKDRGYMFERQLNTNYQNYLNKRLSDYRQPEAEGMIPMMLITPFILNDARRFLISPQGMSYMMHPPDAPGRQLQPEVDGVDFRGMFGALQADSLAFTSALRMNGTYPLVLPNVWLPTTPAVEIVDAGFRDNYGITTAVRFIQVFRDWIQENTSGVVLLQVRCWKKVEPITSNDYKGIVESLFTPGEVLAHLTTVQDYEQDDMLALLHDNLGHDKLELIRFVYQPVQKEHEASLSLHLSKREKLDVRDAFYLPENLANLARLQKALNLPTTKSHE